MKNLQFYILIISMSVLGVFGSLFLYNYLQISQKNLQEHTFRKEGDLFMQALNERIHRNHSLLLGLRGYFAGSEQVTFAEWTTYLDGLNLGKEAPALRFCAYAEMIAKENLDAFVKKIQSFGISDYKVWPADTSGSLLPIVYLYPPDYKKWIGFNLCQDVSNCNALKEGTAEGWFTFDATFSFEQATTKASDMTMWLPLFKNNGSLARWLLIHFDLALLIEQIVSQAGLDHLNIEIYKGSQVDPANLVFSKIPVPMKEATLQDTNSISLSNETLTVKLSTTPLLTDVQTTPPFLILALALTITILSVLILYYLEKRHTHLTQSLGLAKDAQSQVELIRQFTFDAMTYSVICTDPKGTILIFNRAAEQLLGYKADEMIGKMTPESFHDADEMRVRANELTELLGRPVPPTFEVFAALATKGIPDERKWKYIRKDKSVVEVNLIVSALKDSASKLIGYMGVARKL